MSEQVVAIVTGAASGLGAASARALAERGMRVIVADLNQDRGDKLASELPGAVFHKTDVSDPDSVAAAVERSTELGTLRVAVSCAGVGWAARTVDKRGVPHDIELYRKVIGVNQVGTFNLLRLAAARMVGNSPDDSGARGVIINTASIAAFDGQVGQLAYAASKAAVVGMTLPAARDLSPSGIRVMTIAPGVFDTPMMQVLPEPAREALAGAMVAAVGTV